MENNSWRHKLQQIIYEAETPLGKVFDVSILIIICLSVIAVCLETVESINNRFGQELLTFEWIVTILFTIEYILRIISIGRPFKYIFSFFGLIDLMSIIPTYLSFFMGDIHYLLVIRALRLLRVFRIFKLGRYIREGKILRSALQQSGPKITVFLISVLSLVIIIGSLMYLIEGAERGYTSIPRSIYWAIVTLTTVGYGDITPQTIPGQMLASAVMIMGYGIIAVPTGIVTAELTSVRIKKVTSHACPECSHEGHEPNSEFCYKCGGKLHPD